MTQVIVKKPNADVTVEFPGSMRLKQALVHEGVAYVVLGKRGGVWFAKPSKAR